MTEIGVSSEQILLVYTLPIQILLVPASLVLISLILALLMKILPIKQET